MDEATLGGSLMAIWMISGAIVIFGFMGASIGMRLGYIDKGSPRLPGFEKTMFVALAIHMLAIIGVMAVIIA